MYSCTRNCNVLLLLNAYILKIDHTWRISFHVQNPRFFTEKIKDYYIFYWHYKLIKLKWQKRNLFYSYARLVMQPTLFFTKPTSIVYFLNLFAQFLSLPHVISPFCSKFIAQAREIEEFWSKPSIKPTIHIVDSPTCVASHNRRFTRRLASGTHQLKIVKTMTPALMKTQVSRARNGTKTLIIRWNDRSTRLKRTCTCCSSE